MWGTAVAGVWTDRLNPSNSFVKIACIWPRLELRTTRVRSRRTNHISAKWYLGVDECILLKRTISSARGERQNLGWGECNRKEIKGKFLDRKWIWANRFTQWMPGRQKNFDYKQKQTYRKLPKREFRGYLLTLWNKKLITVCYRCTFYFTLNILIHFQVRHTLCVQ